MENLNYLIIVILVLYLIYDLYNNAPLLKDSKMLFLGIYNLLFLAIVISCAILKPGFLISYWWIIVLLGLPSIIYQIVKFRKSDEPILSKFIKLSVLLFFVIFVVIQTT